MIRRIGWTLLIVSLPIAAYLASLWFNPYGAHEGPGEVTAQRVSADRVAAREDARASASNAERQILFGDLHVHTTYSSDAFFLNLPLLQGAGAHPPADACDFARFCSALDFWSINDHAESLTPRRWRETQQSIEQCNEVAGDDAPPDTVAFLGWEWTQVGRTPATHYGHKNVIFRDTGSKVVPRRPIAARGANYETFRTADLSIGRIALPLIDFPNRQRYFDLDVFFKETAAAPECPAGVAVRELPDDCVESATTPAELFDKLDQWDFPSIVIPHGTTWGATTPRGATWDDQLRSGNHDPDRQTMIEVYSGHGGSEEYRDWRHIEISQSGERRCPEPRDDFVAACWHAGEIIRARCLAAAAATATAADLAFVPEEGEEGEEPLSEAVCDARATLARQRHVDAEANGFMVVPGQKLEDWLDSGQCRDCFAPAMGYRPGKSVQYALAKRHFGDSDDDAEPARFRFGLMASSDNHSARPGTGYKEVAREGMSDNRGLRDSSWREWLPAPEPSLDSVAVAPSDPQAPSGAERSASFMLTGGLIGLHADGRDRASIWQALERKQVYGTSGPRILLWFDWLGSDGKSQAPLPMGSDLVASAAPRFRVRAVGAFEQKPGCPEHVGEALGQERLEALCLGECYNPSDARVMIDRIEVVRIRPQMRNDEALGSLIEDPWLTLPCSPDPMGCDVEFEDPSFADGARDTVYYVRAIQQPSPAVNGNNLRCKRDDRGECIEVTPCRGGYHNSLDDGCLSEIEERAWSSPIFVDYGETS